MIETLLGFNQLRLLGAGRREAKIRAESLAEQKAVCLGWVLAGAA